MSYLVINNQKRILGFPYPEKKEGNIEVQRMLYLKPGKKIVKKEVWEALLEQNKLRFENYYDKYVTYTLLEEKKIEKNSNSYIDDFSVKEASEIVEKISSQKELEELKKYEKKHKKRKTIIKEIDKQIEYLDEMDEKHKKAGTEF